VQRNAALRSAGGEIIYFLDDDSRPAPANLTKAISHFHNQQTAIVGGPNLCPPDAPRLEQIFAVVLSSRLGFSSSRARYEAIGTVREGSEKELILCNLLARRDALLELGGFDTALYPNEENALMDELQNGGRKLVYDPDLVVYRRPRPTLRAFCKMLLNYGRGRAEQFRRHPTLGSALNLVPPLFCLYLIVGPWFAPVGLLPLAFYALALLGQFAVLAVRKPFLHAIAAVPLIVVTHIFYGLGFWRGLFTKLKPQTTSDTPVDLEIMKL
jgi:GT2 family glycosyltransferase